MSFILDKITFALANIDFCWVHNIYYPGGEGKNALGLRPEYSICSTYNWYNKYFSSIKLNILPIKYKLSSWMSLKVNLLKFDFTGNGSYDDYDKLVKLEKPEKNIIEGEEGEGQEGDKGGAKIEQKNYLKTHKCVKYNFSISLSIDIAKKIFENRKLQNDKKVDI